jgi:hypothetical protein
MNAKRPGALGAGAFSVALGQPVKGLAATISTITSLPFGAS